MISDTGTKATANMTITANATGKMTSRSGATPITGLPVETIFVEITSIALNSTMTSAIHTSNRAHHRLRSTRPSVHEQDCALLIYVSPRGRLEGQLSLLLLEPVA